MARILYEQGKKSQKTIYLHLICWTIFIAYEVSLSALAYGPVPLVHYLLFYIINIGIFYVHSGFLFVHFASSMRKKVFIIALFIIFEMTIYCLVAISFSSLISTLIYHKGYLDFLDLNYIVITSYRAMSFVLYGTGYYFLVNYIHKREKSLIQDIENEKLKNDILRTEQDFLRAQINPHLLFNTLSFIKYAARKKPEEADEAVMRLSAIMGFALENNSETILVTKELEQVENIIALNQLRYNHTLNINFIKDLQNRNATIVPIVLLTLVENVFKHGELLQAEHPAEFWIESTDQYLLVKTSNLPSFSSGVTSTNKGLANIKSRMNQFYGDRFYLEHYIDGLLFKVELKINY